QRCTFISIRLIGPPGEQFRQTSLDRRAIAWTYIAFGRLEPGTIYARGYTGRVCNCNKCAKTLTFEDLSLEDLPLEGLRRSKICDSRQVQFFAFRKHRKLASLLAQPLSGTGFTWKTLQTLRLLLSFCKPELDHISSLLRQQKIEDLFRREPVCSRSIAGSFHLTGHPRAEEINEHIMINSALLIVRHDALEYTEQLRRAHHQSCFFQCFAFGALS